MPIYIVPSVKRPAIIFACEWVYCELSVKWIETCFPSSAETVVYRMSKSSGVDGMGGMPPLSYWANYPDIGIARPLLACPRVSG